MSASDADTIWMSRIDMNIPNTMMRNAISRLGGMRSEAAGFIIDGGAVVASAMKCSDQKRYRPGAPPAGFLLRQHRGRVEVGFAFGILGAFGGIDGDVDRHPGAQQVLLGDILWHAHANR